MVRAACLVLIVTLLAGTLLLFGVDLSAVFAASLVLITTLLLADWIISRRYRALVRSAQELERAIEDARTGLHNEPIDSESMAPELQQAAFAIDKLMSRVEQLVVGLRSISGNIAHEMARPIAKAVDQANDLSSNVAHPSPNLLQLVEQVELLQQIYSGILDIVELEAGSEIKVQRIDFSDVVLETAAMFEDIAVERNVSVDVEIEPTPVFGNYWLLLQAVSNLLSNSLRFTPERSTIQMVAKQLGSEAQFMIEDAGSGVPDACLEDLLRRITRERSNLDEVDHGLGLRMVLATVIRHGGRMGFATAKKGGFCIEIILPIATLDDGPLRSSE